MQSENKTQCEVKTKKPRNKMPLEQRILDALKNWTGLAPDRDTLQRMAGIKRRNFIPALKILVTDGAILKVGDGTRGSAFRYKIPNTLA
jgi:hypothetical protein